MAAPASGSRRQSQAVAGCGRRAVASSCRQAQGVASSRRQSQAVASCLALFLCDLVLADSLFSLCVSGPLETSSWLSPGHFGSS